MSRQRGACDGGGGGAAGGGSLSIRLSAVSACLAGYVVVIGFMKSYVNVCLCKGKTRAVSKGKYNLT